MNYLNPSALAEYSTETVLRYLASDTDSLKRKSGPALIAMNGMAGMLKGYSEGRADLFNQEKAKYDEGMKAVQMHNQQITDAVRDLPRRREP